jgi:hypothetical protein
MLLTPALSDGVGPTAQVQVFFGEHLVVDWHGAAEIAPAVADGLQRRFRSLRVVGPQLEPVVS